MKPGRALGTATIVILLGCDGGPTVEPTTTSRKLWCDGQELDPELLKRLPAPEREVYIEARGCVWGDAPPPQSPEPIAVPAMPSSDNGDREPLPFPLEDFCTRLDALAGGALGFDACADAHEADLNFNRSAMDAYYGCIQLAETWEQANDCQDQQRNGKSPTFAYEFAAEDRAHLGEVAPMTFVQIHEPWLHTVLYRGELLVVVTAKDTTERSEVIATCLARDGWESAAAALNKPTKMWWLLGAVVSQTEASQGKVPAMAGCYWAEQSQ